MFLGNGQVVARSGLGFVLELERVPLSAFEQAADGEVVVLTGDADDRVRALVRLDNFVDAYLFVGRFVEPAGARVHGAHAQSDRRVPGARDAPLRHPDHVRDDLRRGRAALLLAAVRVGLGFANRLAKPISRLITAADRVRVGDLSVSVPEREEGHEIDRLSRAFNRMTAQLASQRAELISANNQLDERRRFTETVIGGVSAGCSGLDHQGRITAEPLGRGPDQGGARRADRSSPDRRDARGGRPAGARGDRARAPRRGADRAQTAGWAHTLLVRSPPSTTPMRIGGYVVTFDDITELLAAQRKAAWAEIARRIAHEIKNPLTPIRLSAERLRRNTCRRSRTARRRSPTARIPSSARSTASAA